MKLAFVFFLFPILTSVSARAVVAAKRQDQHHDRKTNSTTDAASATGDAQKSQCLDPTVLETGFQQNGVAGGEPNQTASLTSSNNFINFCASSPGTPLTNGTQNPKGSCNQTPMGFIPAANKMPAAKFVNPTNGATVKANQTFTVQVAVLNLATGFFANADTNYFAAPTQLNDQGLINGHSHIVMQKLESLASTTPIDPQNFDFFVGLNDAAVGNTLTANVTGGLAPGAYRACTINTNANHHPVAGPLAKRGSHDDCIYFTAEDAAGKNSGGGGKATDENGDASGNGGSDKNGTASDNGRGNKNGTASDNGRGNKNGHASGKAADDNGSKSDNGGGNKNGTTSGSGDKTAGKKVDSINDASTGDAHNTTTSCADHDDSGRTNHTGGKNDMTRRKLKRKLMWE